MSQCLGECEDHEGISKAVLGERLLKAMNFDPGSSDRHLSFLTYKQKKYWNLLCRVEMSIN